MANKLKTSEKTEEILMEIDRSTNLGYTPLARIAISLSLIRNGDHVSESKDYKGKEFNKYSLIGDYEEFYRALLSKIYNKKVEGEEFYSNSSLIKNHLDDGAEILGDIYEKMSKDPNEFLAQLSSLVESESDLGIESGEVSMLDIEVGTRLNDESVVFELNKATNPHMGIMGTTGCGKTQLLLNILFAIRQKSDLGTNFIFFDYKGEFIDGEGEPEDQLIKKFIQETESEVYQLPTNTIPINPFLLNSYTEKQIKLSAEEKADSFSSVKGPGFGEVQRGNLVKAIKAAYTDRKNEERKYPDLNEVYSNVKDLYERDNKNKDSLTEIMRQLAEFDLFWSHGSKNDPIRELTKRTLIIDLSSLPERLKQLAAYLIIEQLYREISHKSDSRVTDDGYRKIRTCLVIDEAHHYLPQQNLFLQRILREGRSKGVAVFLASQSPKDYNQKFFDFREFLEFPIIMKSKGTSKKMLQSLLGVDNQSAQELKQKIPNLENFEIISKPQKKSDDYLQFTGNPFFRRFK